MDEPARMMPRYPVYIPSKGRYDHCLTGRMLDREGVPFRLVVEESEASRYAERFGSSRLLVLPFTGRGSVIPTRNWIKAHAIAEGHERHWQLDDNMDRFLQRIKTRRIPCAGGVALAAVEDFTDRYDNVAISGLNYEMFVPTGIKLPPFHRNARVYSCSLINNAIPHRWRGAYNEDTDLCLQVLADGWCTILVNAFLVHKHTTMKVPGGNTQALYQGDGRLRMARSLQRLWPGVVETDRRFHRPQHVVKHSWKRFDTPLIPRPSPRPARTYGRLVQVKPVQSPTVRELFGLDPSPSSPPPPPPSGDPAA